MKTHNLKLLAILCCLLITHIISAQQKSKSEEFDSAQGTLIEKQYISLGIFDEIDVRLVKMKNLFTNETCSAVRFEYLYSKDIQKQTKLGYIDADEVDNLIVAIKQLQTSVFNQEYLFNTEITFKCRSGLIMGCFFNKDTKRWITYLQLKKDDPKSTVEIENDNFEYFKSLLEKAKGNL